MRTTEAVTEGTIPIDEAIDKENCCQAGFDVEDEMSSDYRQALLSACSQTYVWEAENEQCMLISYNEAEE